MLSSSCHTSRESVILKTKELDNETLTSKYLPVDFSVCNPGELAKVLLFCADMNSLEKSVFQGMFQLQLML